MTRGILIAGNESSLFNAVAAEAVKRVESFVSAVIPNRFLLSGDGIQAIRAEAAGIPLSWNPGSPISARTTVLAAENRLQKIDEAILVCLPPAVFRTTGTLTPEEVEILSNDQIKGWFFLIRELILYFRRAGAGSLYLVAPELRDGAGLRKGNERGKHSWSKNAQVDLLGPSAIASFRAFSDGVLVSSANEPFQVTGFTGYEAGAEREFAAWFFKTVDEGTKKDSGRWHKYSRRGFFRF
jgi:hypothetical protein